jgi:transposase
MASGFTVCWKERESKVTLLMLPRLRPRAGGGGPRRTGLTEKPWCAHCLRTNAVNRASAPWLGPRRLKMKIVAGFAASARRIAERVQHVNRIKGLLFSQDVSDYEPLRRNRRQRLDELKMGDSRPLPPHLKAQISRELDRLELLIEQVKAVETERDALLAPAARTEQQAMLMDVKGIGAEFAAVLRSEGLYRSFANRKQVAAHARLPPTPWQRDPSRMSKACSKPVIRGCGQL